MLDAALRPLIDPPLDRLARRLAVRGIGANAITVAGFGAGVLAMAAIALQLYLLGLGLLILNRLADGLDGAVARHRGPTDLGGFLDITLDFILYSGVVFAFALADPPHNALAAAFLIFSFIGTGCSFLAFAVMAAKRSLESRRRGRKSLYYLGGLTEGTETIAFFCAFCLFPGWFPPLAVLFGVMCWFTTVARFVEARMLLSEPA